MTIFRTTAEQRVQISVIAASMNVAKLPVPFIDAVSRLAQEDQGIFELMALWQAAAEDVEERVAVEADLQEHLEEAAELPSEPVRKPKIPFDDLTSVASQVMRHKQRLREIVDRHGGVSEVARKCGMAQPSLSRMLTSASMPRRSTLYKIANALGLPEQEIVGEWRR
jgi:hypothetical protein